MPFPAIALSPHIVKIALVGLAALAIVTVIGVAYHHYQGLLKTINVLEANNAKLGIAVETQKRTTAVALEAIDQWAEQSKLNQAAIEEAREVSLVAEDRIHELRKMFSKHDLALLAKKKPGLIARKATRGTNLNLLMFECSTGARDPDCPSTDNPTGPGRTNTSPGSNENAPARSSSSNRTPGQEGNVFLILPETLGKHDIKHGRNP